MSNLANTLAKRIGERQDRSPFLVAIDGRCASGKTTLANELQALLPCAVIHMDDFFLRPSQRTEERLRTAGENVDHERFLEEVLVPLRRGATPSYRPFSCKTLSLGEPILLPSASIYLIEGSYACHPTLRPYYDLTVFLTTSEDEQMRRIKKRNGDMEAVAFQERWIPMEEAYFSAFHIAEQCDCRFEN